VDQRRGEERKKERHFRHEELAGKKGGEEIREGGENGSYLRFQY